MDGSGERGGKEMSQNGLERNLRDPLRGEGLAGTGLTECLGLLRPSCCISEFTSQTPALRQCSPQTPACSPSILSPKSDSCRKILISEVTGDATRTFSLIHRFLPQHGQGCPPAPNSCLSVFLRSYWAIWLHLSKWHLAQSPDLAWKG